jgi:hypothetical protein
MKRLWWCAVCVIAGVAASAAQKIRVPESWDKLAAQANESVKVTMDRKMLQFASKFMNDEHDQEGKNLILKLNGIYVRNLEFSKPGAYTEADVAPIRSQLEGNEWSHVVEVDSQEEKVDVYIKTVNDQTMGMVVLACEPTELTLVHLDGPINPEDLDELSGNFGIPKNVHGLKKPSGQPPTASAKRGNK